MQAEGEAPETVSGACYGRGSCCDCDTVVEPRRTEHARRSLQQFEEQTLTLGRGMKAKNGTSGITGWNSDQLKGAGRHK